MGLTNVEAGQRPESGRQLPKGSASGRMGSPTGPAASHAAGRYLLLVPYLLAHDGEREGPSECEDMAGAAPCSGALSLPTVSLPHREAFATEPGQHSGPRPAARG